MSPPLLTATLELEHVSANHMTMNSFEVLPVRVLALNMYNVLCP